MQNLPLPPLRTSVALNAEKWSTVIHALRFAAHQEPGEELLGVGIQEQDDFHEAARLIAIQLNLPAECEICVDCNA